MRKIIGILLFASICMMLVACGDDGVIGDFESSVYDVVSAASCDACLL